jgi:hypothetical protein
VPAVRSADFYALWCAVLVLMSVFQTCDLCQNCVTNRIRSLGCCRLPVRTANKIKTWHFAHAKQRGGARATRNVAPECAAHLCLASNSHSTTVPVGLRFLPVWAILVCWLVVASHPQLRLDTASSTVSRAAQHSRHRAGDGSPVRMADRGRPIRVPDGTLQPRRIVPMPTALLPATIFLCASLTASWIYNVWPACPPAGSPPNGPSPLAWAWSRRRLESGGPVTARVVRQYMCSHREPALPGRFFFGAERLIHFRGKLRIQMASHARALRAGSIRASPSLAPWLGRRASALESTCGVIHCQ